MMFKTIADIRAANRKHGGHFFNPYNLRLTRTKVITGVIGSRCFVTSHRDCDDQGCLFPPTYKARLATDDGTIETIGIPHGYMSLPLALRAAQAEPRCEFREGGDAPWYKRLGTASDR